MKISFLLSVIALSFSFCPLAKAQSSGGVTSPEVWFRTVLATSNLQGYYLWKDFSGDSVRNLLYDSRGAAYVTEFRQQRDNITTFNFHPALDNITDIIGDYEACIIGHHKTKVNYMLKIMPDSFCLNILGQDYDIICTGRLINKKDFLLLKCREEKDIDVLLSNGYSNKREYIVKILNRKKIKLDEVILKRK